MAERVSGVKASVGFASEIGPRERNEDFAGAVFGSELPQPRGDIVAAIADGVGAQKGDALQPRWRCAAFSMASAIYPRRWKSGAQARESSIH